MALYHFSTKPLSRGTRNTVGAVAYRAGCKLYDERTGESFNYQNKAVQHVELLLPKDAPQWAYDVQALISEDRQKGVQVFGSSKEFWSPEQFSLRLSQSGEKLSAADYLDAESLTKLMQKEDHRLTKIFDRVSNELEAMGAILKKVFWQVADHFLGIEKSKNIRIDPQTLKTRLREERRAEKVLRTKDTYEGLTKVCELNTYLKSENRSLTPELKGRITLQSERAATFILHRHMLKGTEPTQDETKFYLLRAKYELDRLPQIQQELMDQGENSYQAYRIADCLASIEGRLTFEARGSPTPALSFL